MTYTERLRNAAQLIEDEEIAGLVFLAADRIDQLSIWKLKWAELDHAYSELRGRYQELQKTLETLKKENQ
jgi:hypothetical protein